MRCLLLLGAGIGVLSIAVSCHQHDTSFDNDAPMPETVRPRNNRSENGFRASVVYSPKYLIRLGGLERTHPFDIHKYKHIHNQLIADGLLTEAETLRPKPLSNTQILRVQSQQFLDSLKNRNTIARYLEAPQLVFVPMPLDRCVLRPFRYASGGTLVAARAALEHGIGINLGGGYHHGRVHSGEGFCIYADVPIAIRLLQDEGLIERALVIDVDVHQGNGTAECLANDDTTFTFSMHEGDIYPFPKAESDLDIELDAGTGDQQYLEILRQTLPEVFAAAEPDIVFVVAGCDTLVGDPLAHLSMTRAGVVERDLLIIAAAVGRNIPIVYTLGGGYSRRAWKVQHEVVDKMIRKYGLAPSAAESTSH